MAKNNSDNCFIITLKDDPERGSFSVRDEFDNVVLYLFKNYDDADRFASLFEADHEDVELEVYEVNIHGLEAACGMYGYNYIVFSEDDIVVPPDYCDFV
jgi:hypothetical protein